jgi:hypothetical protein
MDQDLGLRIVLVVAGFLILAFGVVNELSNGWQLDIVNLFTIFGGYRGDPARNCIKQHPAEEAGGALEVYATVPI